MKETMKLAEWERGLRVESRARPDLFAFLWFYEWHLFDAVLKGEHTGGTCNWPWHVAEDSTAAHMDAGWLKLRAGAVANGARLALEITNDTAHDWPAIAAIIPCFNPGDPKQPSVRNPLFLDEAHTHTYFRAENGLELIKGAKFPRELHFNHEYRTAAMAWDKERADGRFVFDEKWPTSERDAYAGIMIRESRDNRYVMGIAWNAFLSVQGHNPWNCMHLSVRVGPLAKGETNRIRGKLYLLEGSKEDCLAAFESDFR